MTCFSTFFYCTLLSWHWIHLPCIVNSGDLYAAPCRVSPPWVITGPICVRICTAMVYFIFYTSVTVRVISQLYLYFQIITNVRKRFLDVFCVVFLGDILKLWLRISVQIESVGDSQKIDTYVPPVCPLSHLDHEDGGSMFLQIDDKQPTSTWCRKPQNRNNIEYRISIKT